MVAGHFMPRSSIDILVPKKIDVKKIEKSDRNASAQICYSVRFLVDLEALKRFMADRPDSDLARKDRSLIKELEIKFGDFRRNEIKSRCDKVLFTRRDGVWTLSKI